MSHTLFSKSQHLAQSEDCTNYNLLMFAIVTIIQGIYYNAEERFFSLSNKIMCEKFENL